MNTVAEITKALPNLSTAELQQIERLLINIYRQRKSGIIFDDAYGVWTEEDQASVAAQVFEMLDEEEARAEKGRKP